jgi:acyl-CoA synthetase (NDP forming)
MSDARRAAVAAMLGARSVALVGASARPDSLGARMIIEAQRSSTRMQLVNPRYSDIDGIPCAPTLADVDGPVDLALLGVPDSALIEQLEAAAAAGVRGAVLFGGAHGLRDKVTAIAEEAGMALCGAACMGFVNNTTGLRALGYLEPDPIPVGGISLVSHSGSAFSTLLRSHRGLGFRLAVSSGQELVTDAADYVEYALDDPGTELVALLLEMPRAVPRLRSALLRAAERKVPVIVLPVGVSPTGREMVAAHSGALAGDDVAWHAFCASVGAVLVRDLAEFTDTVELFAAGRRARGGIPTGAIATVHDSGAERALTADIAHQLAVEFAALSDNAVAAISELLDDGLIATNPLDVWGTGADTRKLFRACLRVLSDDLNVAVTALAVDLVPEYDGDTAYADALLDVADATKAPLAVLASVPSAVDRNTADRLRTNGVPVLEGTRSGLAALGHLARWPRPIESQAVETDEVRRRRWLDWLDAWDPRLGFNLLTDYGVPVTEARTARSLDDVLAAAKAIGYPVALKTLAAEHKSDVGGVVLGVEGPAELSAAYADLAARLGPDVTIQAMAGAGVEVSVGIVRDPAFGPLLVVAAGGTLIELVVDRAVAVPPISTRRAMEMIDSLRVRKLLDGWRGTAPADALALARAIAAFSTIAVELGDAVDAIEANPVIVSTTSAVAVDALVYPRTQKIE